MSKKNQNGSDHPAPAGPPPLPQEHNHRILIIDDTRAIHDDFRKILSDANIGSDELGKAEAALFDEVSAVVEQKNYILDSAYQGQEGLAMVLAALQEGNRYEMAFVDVRMPPGWDGIETIGKIWEFDPDLQVVICTAYSDYSWKDMIAKFGATDRLVILKKPFDPVEAMQLANAMTEKWRLLQKTRSKLDELEGLVAERTRHLQETNSKLQAEIVQRERREQCLTLQSDVTRVLADSAATSEQIVQKILETICQGMHWGIGVLWSVDRQAKTLRFNTIWHPSSSEFTDFNVATKFTVFNSGADVPGRVWESGQPLWISDIATVPDLLRLAVAIKAGFRAAFAFPLRLQGETIGVLEFYGGEIRQPEPDMLQMFATLGSQIGQSIDRKKLEEQLRQSQKMDAVGHLAGGVAHDFNNMLTVIQGYAQILKVKPGLDQDTIEGLTQINVVSDRAANLTRQLLAFSRKQLLQYAKLDLNTVIAKLSSLLQRTIGEDMKIRINYSPEPAIVEADENMISQILINLTVNARDAMPNGGRLAIQTEMITVDESGTGRHAEARTGEFVCLSVSDSGCGIPPGNLPHIFEPFFSTKAVGKGTGLGLSTVYGIVQQHEGWIEVASQIGGGTAFKIFLPHAKTSPPAVTEKDFKTGSDAHGGKETILLTEDESQLRDLARGVLQRSGYRVLEARSGVEALSVWEKNAGQIDLLLTDIVMPDGVNGRELAQQLQAKRPGLKVIFTSGYNPGAKSVSDHQQAKNNYLAKPYQPQKLVQKVREILDGKPAETEAVAAKE